MSEDLVLTPVAQLNEMIRLAAVAHKGQVDKGGAPYLLHPLTVAQNLKTQDYELMAIAVGHDLLEDTPITANYLHELGFSERVIRGIQSLTRESGESKNHYKHRISLNRDALLVKIEDSLHNSDLSRLGREPTEKDIARNAVYADNIVWYRTKLAVMDGEMEDPDA